MKIAAVVVTHNRLNLLQQCIDAIRNQTRKVDEIIVVNNNSNDGTLEWLSQQNDLTVITQENSGSAGGQYTGIKTAYEKGYDWIWCMDDDCYPKYDCLEKQLLSNENIITQPRIIDSNGNDIYNYLYFERQKFYHKLYNKLRIPYKNLVFNGLLISKLVISKIGFPIKDFFIYGDDLEYTFRAQKAGFKISIMYNATIIHPPIKPLKSFSEQNLFYYFRNLAYTFNKYSFMKIRLIKHILVGIKLSYIHKKNIKLIMEAIRLGIQGKFN